ncbi:Uncharacterized protein APZ42_031086 [Daphnia magna]|uniref:Uncharacterized protein n=1 Tax=Daphnia magna TaxID=35525 RepID=A0A164N5X3_9CRUS|nr:Uncharacterized protein APZ42_031086 [Daphnia magna]
MGIDHDTSEEAETSRHNPKGKLTEKTPTAEEIYMIKTFTQPIVKVLGNCFHEKMEKKLLLICILTTLQTTLLVNLLVWSFDTVYSQETKLLSAIECWEMVNNKKCGGNLMQAGTTTLTFTSTPTGEGKWYAIKEYHALNCLAEEITLKQETPESLVESPFGILKHHSARRRVFTKS